MITININESKVEVPTFKELTVKQYRDVVPFISTGSFVDILRYVSITTGTEYEKALNCKFTGTDRLNNLMPDFLFIAGDIDTAGRKGFIETAKPRLMFKYTKYIYPLAVKSLSAVGYRIVLEQFLNTKPTYLDLYVFMLALVINTERVDKDNAFDYKTISYIAKDLDNYNAYHVLTLGSFFFWKWSKGELKESRLSKILRKVIMISIRQNAPKLVLIDSRSITQSKK